MQVSKVKVKTDYGFKFINESEFDEEKHTLFENPETESKLPDDFPHGSYFEKAGYESVEEIKAIETLTDVKGISENRAEDVTDYLNG